MYARATGTYREVAVLSATPERVLDEVFSRLLRDCAEARAHITAHDYGAKGRAIGHALELVAALSGALDYKAAPDLCRNLAALYQFVRERLLEANARMVAEPILEAETILQEVRTGFEAAGVRTA